MSRRRTLTCLVVILMACWLPRPAGAVSISLTNDHNNIGVGDTVSATVAVANSDPAVAADAYLVLVQPDQSLIFYELTGSGLVPHPGTSDPATWVKLVSNFTLPSGFSVGPIPLASFTGTGAKTPGLYQWIFAFVQAGTFTVLDLKSAPFFLASSPVLSLLGSYNVTSTIPSLGSSGSGTAAITDGDPGTLLLTASGYSAGYTSSYTGTVTLDPQGGSSWSLQGNIFGTIVQGSGTVDAAGYLTGSINTVTVGPFIKSITNLTGQLGIGQFQATYTTTFTDGASGTEYLTATHQ